MGPTITLAATEIPRCLWIVSTHELLEGRPGPDEAPRWQTITELEPPAPGGTPEE